MQDKLKYSSLIYTNIKKRIYVYEAFNESMKTVS